jgi:hypothetical protein
VCQPADYFWNHEHHWKHVIGELECPVDDPGVKVDIWEKPSFYKIRFFSGELL